MLADAELADAHALTGELGAWAVGHLADLRPTSVRTKRDSADLVTEVDEGVERHVREVIGARFPAHRIIGEEDGETGDEGAPTWYLDPVDGTTNFVNGVPWFSFSLALADGAPGPDSVGTAVVADPSRGEIFSAIRGQGSRLNGKPIACSPATTLAGGVFFTEWRAHAPWPGMDAMLHALSTQHCTARIMGSSAMSTVSIAAGRGQATVIGRYSPIDDLAGAFISQEAGAAVLDVDGNRTLMPSHGGILVAAPGVADAAWTAWTAGLPG